MIKYAELKLADNNLNCVRCFEQKSIGSYIGGTAQHMGYACTFAIQTKGKYKGQSRRNHMAITWKLRYHVSSQFIISCFLRSAPYVTAIYINTMYS